MFLEYNKPFINRFPKAIASLNCVEGLSLDIYKEYQAIWSRNIPNVLFLGSPSNRGHMFGTIELEEAILGAIMLEKSAFDVAVEILKPQCFYLESHQRIYQAMQSLANKSMPIDLLTVVEELRTREDLEFVGGPYYVTKLTIWTTK